MYICTPIIHERGYFKELLMRPSLILNYHTKDDKSPAFILNTENTNKNSQ